MAASGDAAGGNRVAGGGGGTDDGIPGHHSGDSGGDGRDEVGATSLSVCSALLLWRWSPARIPVMNWSEERQEGGWAISAGTGGGWRMLATSAKLSSAACS